MAHAYVVLETNQGNVKRTARDCNLPESTIRRWRDLWLEEGPPDLDEVAIEATDFVEDAERVRDKALKVLEGKLDAATPSALVATIGMLQDKVSIARGLATSRTETVHALPSPQEIANTLGAVLAGAIEAAKARDQDILEADLIDGQVVIRELPSAEQA
jgi:transposase-like protein